jgi:hypothetical protein
MFSLRQAFGCRRFKWLVMAISLSALPSLAAADSYRLRVPLRTSNHGVAELYYNLGSGFKKSQRSSRPVRSSSVMQKVDFDLPSGVQITRLRLDPLNGAGIFDIGRAEVIGPDGRRARTIETTAYKVHHQLSVLSQSADVLRVYSPPGSLDPILLITLPHPLLLLDKTEEWSPLIDWFLTGLSVLVVIACILFRSKCNSSRKANLCAKSVRLKYFDRVAQKITDAELITFDRASISILLSSVTIFVLSCFCGWHASSTAKWDSVIAGKPARTGLVCGEPKNIRIDEWRVFTPNTFSQLFSANRFAVENPVVGGAKTVLFWSWPVNHFIEIPRIHLWPFHVLPVNWGFSVYWNLKGLILFVGLYLFLLLLTGSRSFLSAAGALWIYFSSIVQWWYSHCLPECIGFACLTFVAFTYLALSRKKGLLLFAAPVFVVSFLDFVLIFYPPYAVPVMWVMLTAGIGFLIEKRRLLFGTDPLKIRWLIFAAPAVICGTVLGAFVINTRDTISIILGTIFPGHRSYSGGNATLMTLFVSFIDAVFTEKHFPLFVGNVCEGSGIYLGGLVAMPMVFFANRENLRYSAVDVALALVAAAMSVFLFFGFPHFLAKITLFSMTITEMSDGHWAGGSSANYQDYVVFRKTTDRHVELQQEK